MASEIRPWHDLVRAPHHNEDKTCNKSCKTYTSLAALISVILCVYSIMQELVTCSKSQRTAYRPVDGISPLSDISRLLTEHVPDDRHHGRGAAHFLATFIAVVI